MLAVLAIVAPVFALILAGYLSARTGYLSDVAGKAISEFSFRLAMPALLFRTMASVELPAGSNVGLLASFFGAIAVVWLVVAVLAQKLLRRPAEDGAAIALSASYGNIVMLGIPLGVTAFGQEALAPMALIVSVNSPIMWLAATLHMSVAEARSGTIGGAAGTVGIAQALVRELASNPIIVAIVAGSVWRITGLGFSVPVDRALAMLGQAGVPTALVALGLSLAGFRIAGQTPTLALIILAKGVAMPFIAWVLATVIFGLPKLAAGVVVLFAAMPTGANAFLFATRYNRAVNSTSGAIAIGTTVSAFIAGLVIYGLR